MLTDIFQPIGNWLVARQVVGPTECSLLRSEYTPQTGTTFGGYFSAFVAPAATHFVPEPRATARSCGSSTAGSDTPTSGG
jgi:hypothetical protein